MQRFTLRAPRRQTRQQIEFALLNLLVKVGMGAWPSGQEVAVALTELVEVLDSHNRYRFQANQAAEAYAGSRPVTPSSHRMHR